MAIALVTNVAVASANSLVATTSGVNTTGADFIAMVVASYDPDTDPTISDFYSNAYTALTVRTDTALRVRIYHKVAPTVGAGHTFTVTSASQAFPSVAAAAFSGVLQVSPFDVENGRVMDADHSVGTLTASQANSLYIAGLAFNLTAGTVTINSSYTKTDSVEYTSNNFGVGLAYLIQGAAAAVNPVWAWSGAPNIEIGAHAAFKPAVAAASNFVNLERVTRGTNRGMF